MLHKYVDKEEMIKKETSEKEKWKWVLHLKPEKIKKYGRFWRPLKQKD